MLEVIEVPVVEIREGDIFVEGGRAFWTALADAERVGKEIRLRVQHRDGGVDTRVWDDPTVTLNVDREVGA